MTTTRSPRPVRRVRAGILVLLAALVGAGSFIMVMRPGASVTTQDDGAIDATPPPATGPLVFDVDPSIAPERESVGPVVSGGPHRRTGRLLTEDGEQVDLVLDEATVVTTGPGQLDAFLARWDATVLQSLEPDDEGATTHLVRLGEAPVDTDRLALDVLAAEPFQGGTMTASHDAVLRPIAAWATEARNGGPAVLPNWVVEEHDIEDRSLTEAPGTNDAWTWPNLRDGGTFDFGVTGAWELLRATDRLRYRVNVLVHDDGFQQVADLPTDSILRLGEWGAPSDCDEGCRWHGTLVSMAAVGLIDNGFGTAGPAGAEARRGDQVMGPAARLIAVARPRDIFTQLRDLERVAEEESAQIVNMSYAAAVPVAQDLSEWFVDQTYGDLVDEGMLLVGSAGNESTNVDAERCVAGICGERSVHLPCESSHVLCVGGTSQTSTTVHSKSNWGTVDDRRSVEIYGPYRVRLLQLDGNDDLTATSDFRGGTSYSSPFVAGIAALLQSAASYELSPDELRSLLADTANVGGLGAKVTGSQRRVNAREAVAELLGIETAGPTLDVHSPATGADLAVGRVVELSSTAADYLGRDLPVAWRSSVEGDIGIEEGLFPLEVTLGEGTHVLTATATDSAGRMSAQSLTVAVTDQPAELGIATPYEGQQFYEGDPVSLVGHAHDPDTNEAVPASDLRWEVLDGGGSTVFTGTGVTAKVKAGKLDQGTHTVRFHGVGSAKGAEATITFEVIEEPAGAPNVLILEPTDGAEQHTTYGHATVRLWGRAVVDNDVVPGTHYRWTASAPGQDDVVLCEGSDFLTGDDNGGFQQGGTDCHDVERELTVYDWQKQHEDEAAGSTWTIRLDVRAPGSSPDDPAAIAFDQTEIKLIYQAT